LVARLGLIRSAQVSFLTVKLVECPCVATGVDFLNAEKEYTRTNHDANQTSN